MKKIISPEIQKYTKEKKKQCGVFWQEKLCYFRSMNAGERKIEELLSRGVEEIYEEKLLRASLYSGRKLRVKHGIDPTGPRIHLGRAVPLWKLKEFQELGHQIVLIIGDFTAQIGDASDKQAMRKPLSMQEIKANMSGYMRQFGKILDLKKTEVRYNSEWFSRLKIQDLFLLAMHFTSQQMIQRRNFKERWEKGKPIGLHEILYPLLQGYDSVMVKADVEIGGSDQLFNLQIGREIQKIHGQPPQNIMTLKMLRGIDGRKMSTSWRNIIAIDDSPLEQFGKVMSLKDDLIFEYFELSTRTPFEEIGHLKGKLRSGKLLPIDVKFELARSIVALYHGKDKAHQAGEEFKRVFRQRKTPLRLPKLVLEEKKRITLSDLLVKAKLVRSKTEARRLIVQGGVRIDGIPQKEWRLLVMPRNGMVIQVGRRKFAKIKLLRTQTGEI